MLKRESSVKPPMGAKGEETPPKPSGPILAIPAGHHRLRLAVAREGSLRYRRASSLVTLRQRLVAFFRGVLEP